MLGLVLAGGAARGAYEAGVLRFLFTELPKQLGYVPWPDVVSGTSVGALNGVFAAARDEQGIQRLIRRWCELRISDVYLLRRRDVVRAVASAWRSTGPFSLLDTRPLRQMVTDQFPGEALRASIDSGACRAFVISATELLTGYNSLFVDSADPHLDPRPLPGARAYRTRICPDHLLASAALPFLFPPVDVGPGFHVDGGLRQNTPLRPVIRAGVSHVLVVGVKRSAEAEGATPPATVTPNLAFLAGKSLNALILDPVERDLRQAGDVNRILDWGASRYGAEFLEDIESSLGLRPVETHFVSPSEDLGRIAAACYRSSPPPVSGPLRALLEIVNDRANAVESDLLSYLYFDRVFTRAIEALGYEDAMRQQEALARVIEDSRAHDAG